MHHTPVMIDEVIELIEQHAPSRSHMRILDGTLGLGGYSLAMLERFSECSVTGIDRDTQALAFSRERLRAYEEAGRFTAIHSDFGSLSGVNDAKDCDVYVFDLGVSNMQLTSPERGFSFQNDGPLDMRMNTDSPITAADVLRDSDEQTLARIFYGYGEERYSRQIAKAIKHSASAITTTGELVNVIRSSLPQPVQRKMGVHPARRVFQALRIYINDEAGELERLINSLPELSREALIIFVAYHSLEDRIIKHTFRKWQSDSLGKIITKHPLTPNEHEIISNYKARSAKLRAFCLNHH